MNARCWNVCMRVTSSSLLVVAVGCAPDRSISSWSNSLAADTTSVYWIDPYLGLRAFRSSTGLIENLAPPGDTSFNNLKVWAGTLFWSGFAPSASLPTPAAMYATPASGGPSAIVLRLGVAESVVAFDVLGDVIYVYVERDDPGQIVWSLRETSLSSGNTTDVQLGGAAPPPNSSGIGRRGQQVVATSVGVFYLLWEADPSNPAGADALTVFRLSPDGRSERLGSTVPPFRVDTRLAVTSDAAYWLGSDAKTIQAVPLTGGAVRTVFSLEPSSRAKPFGTDQLCTIAASPAHLFAFSCVDTGDPLGWDFSLLEVDPLRGSAMDASRRRAFYVRALTAVEGVAYWFENASASGTARLRRSE